FHFDSYMDLCFPGYSTAQNEVTGPKTKSGPERGSLTVQCNYTSGWKTHRKYWCRGAVWRDCKILVSTTGSEQEVKRDRVSIRDDQENLTFMVTMEDLRRDDADIYWCGIERVGSDHGFPVDVSIDPGEHSMAPGSGSCSGSSPLSCTLSVPSPLLVLLGLPGL
uniref:CD300e molecule n=1 Tax=Spermophilus dauricus TaxID=99837 RepID=A0A8C9P9I3_SPEDA